jgi:hypothetical protein
MENVSRCACDVQPLISLTAVVRVRYFRILISFGKNNDTAGPRCRLHINRRPKHFEAHFCNQIVDVGSLQLNCDRASQQNRRNRAQPNDRKQGLSGSVTCPRSLRRSHSRGAILVEQRISPTLCRFLQGRSSTILKASWRTLCHFFATFFVPI